MKTLRRFPGGRRSLTGELSRSSAQKNGSRSIERYGIIDSGLYGIEEGMVNLLQLRNLVLLDPGFSVIELTKTRGGGPVSENAFGSGWVYVKERERGSGVLEGDEG